MEKIFEQYLEFLPKLQEILDDDFSILLGDTTKVLKFFPSAKIKLTVPDGYVFPEDDPVHQVVAEDKKTVLIVPKEIFGFVFTQVSHHRFIKMEYLNRWF